MIDPKEPTEDPKPSRIVCRFPDGLRTTALEIDLEFVDIVQIELAGHFLLRTAAKMYDQVDALNAQHPQGLVAARAVPQGLKI